MAAVPDPALLGSLLDAFTDEIALLDPQGRIVAVNAAWQRSDGPQEGGIAGRGGPGADYLDGCRLAAAGPASEGAAETLAALQSVLGGERSARAVEYASGGEDARRWHRVTFTALRPPLSGVLVARADITRERPSALALAADARRYREIIEQSPAAIIVQREGIILYVNPAAVRLFGGNAPTDLVGRNLLERVHPEFREVVLARRRRIAEDGGVPPTAELRYLKLDGTPIDVEVQSAGIVYDGAPAIQITSHDISREKEADAARRKIEARFRAVIENSQDGFLLCDKNARLLYRSPAYGRINGYDDAERVGRSGFDTVHPEDLGRVREFWDDLLANPSSARKVEHRIVRSDGAIRWLETAGQNLLQNPDLEAVVITGRDITEKRAAAEALANLAAIVESSNDAIIGKGLDSIISSWNGGAEKIFGYPAREMVGTSITRLFPADRQHEERMILEQVGRGVSVPPFETIRLTKAGVPIHVAVTASPVRDASGRIVGVSKVARDITGRKRAEDHLRETEERYRQLFETEADAILLVDCASGRFLDSNPAATALYGFSREEFALLRQTDISAEGDLSDRALRDRVAAVPRRMHRKKDGTVFPVEIRGSYFTAGGREIHVATIRDLTEQTLANRALEAAERRFRQAQKMEAVGQLAGGVAHDFNNILAAVLMHLSLLQIEKALAPSTRASLRELEIDVQRGATLTRQLLAFSRQQAMAPRPLDLQAVVRGLLNMLRRLLGEQITISLRGARDLPAIQGDPGMLEQVLINLCVNARDAMPKGGEVMLTLEPVVISPETAARSPEARPGHFLRLRVSDTGHGMDADTLGHIFEPFFSTKDIGKGTGLGLATVYGIVSQHGGWVDVQSVVGEGTSFEIYLPTVPAAVPSDDRGETPPPLPTGRETVLFVEDETSLREVTAGALQLHGYRVLAAADGPEALGHWERHREKIDLLFTDLVMPGGVNGRELAAILRADKPALKVLVCTGYGAQADMQELKAKGIPTMDKPYGMAALLQQIRQTLEGS